MNESSLYDFERDFDHGRALEWMQENWTLSFMLSAVYAAFVFGGQHYMRERPKLNLRRLLALWSLSLAVFSIVGAYRTGQYMLHILTTSGFKQSVCDNRFYTAPITKFWAYAFTLSKASELVDTVFIVLRKQPLIFLHWYHHITVLLYTWYTYKGQVAGCSWFMTMNFLVHSIMYSYFAARAAGVRVPRPFAMIITAFQILQMVIGLLIQGLVFLWLHEEDCPSQVDNIFWGSLMYFSYLVLFASFFYNSYLRGSSGDKRTKAD
ncbi:Elongation of very long chain fatty acids protein 6 [Channa argus]|uniref:Elongation of very long chain fatty acids protein n=1 Tax=Channa argus TaxID=215402 RepID=A0A6G1QPS4_CHAAH|nr:Elongation of very long chain fatty acids protein 6 [Channa argus]KAK2884453.1 hypothetical protein Q8A73_020927 [Channa argus]